MTTILWLLGIFVVFTLVIGRAKQKAERDRRREEIAREAELEKTHVRCCDGWHVWWEKR
jgi:hypothetical protein